MYSLRINLIEGRIKRPNYFFLAWLDIWLLLLEISFIVQYELRYIFHCHL